MLASTRFNSLCNGTGRLRGLKIAWLEKEKKTIQNLGDPPRRGGLDGCTCCTVTGMQHAPLSHQFGTIHGEPHSVVLGMQSRPHQAVAAK
jgi:hypothetical protein